MGTNVFCIDGKTITVGANVDPGGNVLVGIGFNIVGDFVCTLPFG